MHAVIEEMKTFPYRISVFTPTYNRGYIIEKLYRSLQRQSFRDFEWIVVDDGSTDNTEALFSQFLQEENSFPIRYVKTANGGKHRAINKGVAVAQGELFFIVDSDDYLPDDALQIISETEKSIPPENKHLFCGVCGQKGYENKNIIGQTFSGDILDITELERTANNISGDKAEVFFTSLMHKYPFPEFEGENFMTECVVWDKIAADGYKLRFFNQMVMICEYLPDGLSAQGDDLQVRNPRGYGLYLHQSAQFGKIQGLKKWNSYLSFYYSLRNHMRFPAIARCLCMNPFVFRLRILGMQIFYKLYDR